MAVAPGRTLETMMAELVHHMNELARLQKEANGLLAEILKAQARR